MRRRLLVLCLICLWLCPAAYAAPETPDLSGYRVCIDPGHQAHLDNRLEPFAPWSTQTKARVAGGAQGVKTHKRESGVNLAIALQLRDALAAMGAHVLLVREAEDVRISNVQRAQCANQFQADVYLRLHCNASSDARKRGIRVYAPVRSAALYYQTDAQQMLAWAQSCADLLQAATGAPSGKGLVTDTYSGSNWAQMPTFLIEMGYMTNERDDLLLQTDAYREGLVLGMAQFIQTLPRDIHRPQAVMQRPVMENHRSTTGRTPVYAACDTASDVVETVARNKRVFVMDDLGDGWFLVFTYAHARMGYVYAPAWEPCN